MDHIELYKIEAVYSTRYLKYISIFSTHKICMEVYLPNLLNIAHAQHFYLTAYLTFYLITPFLETNV